MVGFRSTISQFFPPKPSFTAKNLSNLRGKVYIVTGSNTGVGKELAQVLYSKNAKVYIAARSEEKAAKAIESIQKSSPESIGSLEFLRLDLSDLTGIKATVDQFLSKEDKLHVLFNNAGIMALTPGAKTAQGHEIHLGTNNVGTFLFTKLLTPTLAATAKVEPPDTVRVVWVSSAGAEMGSHVPGGIDLNNLDYHTAVPPMNRYSNSKAGNYLHATEYGKLYKAVGIVSIPLNPGNLDSDLYRDHGRLLHFFMRRTVLHPPIFGAYTELFAGLSPEITIEKTGTWVVPWGRFMPLREDLVAASLSQAEGGTGTAQKFWEWTEEQVKAYV